MKVYGQSQPPEYDLSKVTCPVALISGQNDWIAHPKVNVVTNYLNTLQRATIILVINFRVQIDSQLDSQMLFTMV